jgi:hypothetical protein
MLFKIAGKDFTTRGKKHWEMLPPSGSHTNKKDHNKQEFPRRTVNLSPRGRNVLFCILGIARMIS